MNPTRPRARKGRDLAGDRSPEAVNHFNALCPVGTPVRYWRTLPLGPTLDTRTRSEAFLADSGSPVVFLEGVSGYVSLFHVVAAAELDPRAPAFSLGQEIAPPTLETPR